MNEENKLFYQRLSVYVEAGKHKIEELQTVTLPTLQKRAESMDPEDLNTLSDVTDKLHHFEKKIHDLDITRIISQQMATQIRIIQNANKAMAYKIQSTMKNTIPLWKQQMVIALSTNHTLSAIQADNAIADITNDIFTKNAENVKHVAKQTVKAVERSDVDIVTLKQVNNETVSALKEIQAIQDKSEANRIYAQDELLKMRTELTDALLDITK